MINPHDFISTVQLSPFGEDHWNRIVTYSPIYVHWTDLILMSPKRASKSTSAKRNLVNLVDINTIRLDDEILLNEIDDMRKSAAMSKFPKLKEEHSYHEASFLEEEHDRRTTSPTDEYQQSSNFFHQTDELPKHYAEPLFSNQQYTTKRSLRQPQSSNAGPMKALATIDFGPKPQASLSVQLRQSAITREHALASRNDHRVTSPLTMYSSRRAGGSAHSSRRLNQQYHSLNVQTAQTTETNVMGGLYEELSTDSASTARKSNLRSTNTSRTTLHMLKTKNERTRQKQQIELKTILVKPCRQPLSSDSNLEESIPNSIEIMHQLGGSISAFEKTLRYNYHRQLNQFRHSSTKC